MASTQFAGHGFDLVVAAEDDELAGEERVVSASPKTKVQGRAGRLVPDSVKATMHREQAEPGSGS
jgi:uncharacterized protein